jgi:hypothetical protein
MTASEHEIVTSDRAEMERLVDEEGYSIVSTNRAGLWVLAIAPEVPDFIETVVRPTYERIVNRKRGS